MQSTDLRQIKAAIRDQAFIGSPLVWCSIGRVVAVRRRKGQLLAFIRGWGRWYPVESVSIETRRSRWRTGSRVSNSPNIGKHSVAK